ncbi:ArsR family transcriptional regulator [Thermotomaculum hydrothermale]|uniref:ArsR family transcriptional regulator n=1 Tax=Thermotomaculum hydrothermale TaxID=981385 RepID=A0A7R6PYT3_9BACT|nr:metalloregulator ArsR/SmtB family transcription factor [Thermotomaculum hydrothermale]BBB33350.1 ArsR family transcriptional regulator [Thermotomaculum hydrothermale]
MNNLNFNSQVFKALGDPNRLAIVLMLSIREMCVCEIVDILPVSFSTISSHLKILQNANIVEGRRDGKWVFYKLSNDEFVLDLIKLLKNHFERSKDFKNLADIVNKVSKESCSIKLDRGQE